jgi:hypothetical protein
MRDNIKVDLREKVCGVLEMDETSSRTYHQCALVLGMFNLRISLPRC